MGFLPQGLEPQAWAVFTAIYFALGLLVGLAAKKAIAAVIMMLLAFIIAVVLLGISIAVDVWSLLQRSWSYVVFLYSAYGAALSSYPISFFAGVLIGFWKGKG